MFSRLVPGRVGGIVGVLIVAVTAASSVERASAGEQFPYSAFVTGETPVRSGPGENFYPVLNLKHGDAVEVWRHDAGGWCAIRPPEGSFSWISADFVRPLNDRVGVIAGEQVNVRVGTQFSDLRDAIQIQVQEGEEVSLIEARRIATGDRETWWYKILPPAGEFRWVHESRLVNDPAMLNQPNIATSDATASAASGEAVQVQFVQPTGAAPNDEFAGLETTLNSMEIDLSRMVATEPTAWHFTDMKRRAEAMLERAETPVERSHVRLFLGKLARFEDIRMRYGQIAELRTQTAQIDVELASAVEERPPVENTADVRAAETAKPRQTIARHAAVDISRYDGVGRLTQIVTADAGAARYALTDETGETIALVVAAPGVNLRQYAGLEVGINGIKGFIAEKRMAQLTAKRIDVLTSRAMKSDQRR